MGRGAIISKKNPNFGKMLDVLNYLYIATLILNFAFYLSYENLSRFKLFYNFLLFVDCAWLFPCTVKVFDMFTPDADKIFFVAFFTFFARIGYIINQKPLVSKISWSSRSYFAVFVRFSRILTMIVFFSWNGDSSTSTYRFRNWVVHPSNQTRFDTR